jgi:hypothetical protein
MIRLSRRSELKRPLRPDEMPQHRDRNRSCVVAIDSERRALGMIEILPLRASRSRQNDKTEGASPAESEKRG